MYRSVTNATTAGVLLATMVACSSGPNHSGIQVINTADGTVECQKPVPEQYEVQIQQARADKDQRFRNPGPDEESPLTDSLKEHFTGLKYFPIDPTFRVWGIFEPKPAPRQGDLEQAGFLAFQLQGVDCRLRVFWANDEHTVLFVPFRDENTAIGLAYGGGRYLDTPVVQGSSCVELDFNRAYHPYCLYNHSWICPLPPADNTLSLAVNAGEQLDGKAH